MNRFELSRIDPTDHPRGLAASALALSLLLGGCSADTDANANGPAPETSEVIEDTSENTGGLPYSYFTDNDKRSDALMRNIVDIAEATRANDYDGQAYEDTLIGGVVVEQYDTGGGSANYNARLSTRAVYEEEKPIAVEVTVSTGKAVYIYKVISNPDGTITTSYGCSTGNELVEVKPGSEISTQEATDLEDGIIGMLNEYAVEIPNLEL